MASEIQLFAIREVSEMTGVNPVTLRAWQRRYGLIKPQRTEKGHRLYTREDIDRIQSILSWLEKGVAISKVRPLLDGGMEVPAAQDEQSEWVEPMLSALSECRRAKLEQLLTQLMKEYPLSMFIEKVVEPVDKQVKDPANPLGAIQKSLWQSAVVEHCASLIAKSRKRGGKKALLLSFEPAQDGMTHTIWLAALAMSHEGDNVTILENLPFHGKLHGLEAAVSQQVFEKVVVIGESKLPQAILKQLARLQAECQCPVQLQGSIAVIHAGWQKPQTGVQNDGE
ncbi:MerR family transcriptional regulator [Photobacterium galatheae]|uniref:MerR family transcriptional regulator n=1 Tax=Photobacterium galatheae TaxID=1654360 RepID=UPI00202CE335|nr:MerR family transcriptional regulator [Photobacterium galatheae]MCM0148945.1 MerR family transcriptional regulator [Photobacterium galatheae]